jgi:glycosyltransferase involved in cell wall biosynthesis
MEIVVYDDASTDATAAIVAEVASRDRRVVLVRGGSLPAGWLGKPHACARAAARARGSMLVFVDADVRLAPDGLARTVALLRASGLDLVCPYPRQQAGTVAERLVQPLLQWSWLALLPLRAAECSRRPSLSAANGQLLCVDADAYRRAGGHAAVASSVLEDIDLLRVFKHAGYRGVVTNGTDIATVRMYDGWGALRDGYAKSLWAAGGGPFGSAAQVAFLGWVFVVPAVAALTGSRSGLVGYLAGVASRVVSARASGGRGWPDALAHPVSVTLFGYLTGLSWWRHRRSSATWKGRPL